jgi:hypothetical protein
MVGAAETVAALVESVWLPEVNVVEVAVMFQPAPEPVASPTSNGCVVDNSWSAPVNVPAKLTLAGVLLMNPNVPADKVAVAVVAEALDARTSAPLSATAAPARSFSS